MKQLLVFILFAGIICWMMFSPVYKHVLIMRQSMLQKEADYLLEVGAAGMHGYIDASMIEASKSRLVSAGFTATLLQYEVSTESGISGSDHLQPVPRGDGIWIRISYPYERLLHIDRLIGLEPPDVSQHISAAGMKMSEYVP